jgi:hypothetical protein
MPQAGTGERSESVLLGCLVNDHLRLWRSDGQPECVRVSDPSELRASLARGIAPRTSLVPGRFREAGRLDGAGVLRIARQEFTVEISEEPAVSQALWEAAADVLQDAAADAIGRGEYLVVEPGGWDTAAEPYAQAGARRADGEWNLYVEALPSPRAPSWPDPLEGQPGWGVEAPAEPDTFAALGGLLTDAIAAWAASPFDVVLTFGKQPDGAYSPPDEPSPEDASPE